MKDRETEREKERVGERGKESVKAFEVHYSWKHYSFLSTPGNEIRVDWYKASKLLAG